MDNMKDKVYKYFCVAAPIFSFLILGTTFAGLEVGSILLISGLGTGVVSPVAYLGIDICDKKEKRERTNSSSYFTQIAKMIREKKDEYRPLHENTNYFYDYIERKLNGDMMPTNLQLGDQTLENINQLLVLINTNYYYKIKSNRFIERERLIDQVVGEVIRYLNESKQNEFSHKDVKNVLKRCSYIDEKIAKEIVKEYKLGRFNFNGNIVYAVSKNSKIYDGVSKGFIENKASEFNIDNASDYSLIIEYIINSDEYKKYKELPSLEWDVETLRYMMQVVDGDLKKDIMMIRGNYNRLDMVISFVSNTINYVLVNKKDKVGEDELIKSFKDWDYVPVSLKPMTEMPIRDSLKKMKREGKIKEKSLGSIEGK